MFKNRLHHLPATDCSPFPQSAKYSHSADHRQITVPLQTILVISVISVSFISPGLRFINFFIFSGLSFVDPLYWRWLLSFLLYLLRDLLRTGSSFFIPQPDLAYTSLSIWSPHKLLSPFIIDTEGYFILGIALYLLSYSIEDKFCIIWFTDSERWIISWSRAIQVYRQYGLLGSAASTSTCFVACLLPGFRSLQHLSHQNSASANIIAFRSLYKEDRDRSIRSNRQQDVFHADPLIAVIYISVKFSIIPWQCPTKIFLITNGIITPKDKHIRCSSWNKILPSSVNNLFAFRDM